MKKFIRQIVLFLLLLIGLAYVLDMAFTSVFKKGMTNKDQWLAKMENVHTDVAIIGSSRAWWNIDIKRMEEETDRSALSLANNHFSYAEMLLRMKRFYANGNTMDLLLLQTEYWNMYSQDSSLSVTAYNLLPYLDDKMTYEFLKKRDPDWKKYKHIPFLRYSEYNFQWGMEEVLMTVGGMRNTLFDDKGAFFSNNTFYGKESWDAPLSDTTAVHPDFDALLEFCREKEIMVVVFTAPIYKAKYKTEDLMRMDADLSARQLEYFHHTDLHQEAGNYNDNTHLSLRGGEKYTADLIEIIKAIPQK